MIDRNLGLIFILLVSASCRRFQRFEGEYISGSVSVSEGLFPQARRPNTVLFIVARNHADIPVAVRRFINPSFPLHYSLGRQDLTVPGARWTGPLTLLASVDQDGVIGPPAKGDMIGVYPGAVQVGDSRVDIQINQIN